MHNPHLLATASADRTCRIADLEKGCAVQELGGVAASVKRVRGLNSGSQWKDVVVAGSARDGQVVAWDCRQDSRKDPVASIFVNELKQQACKKPQKLSIGSLSKGLGTASITGIEMLGGDGLDGPYLFVS